MIPIFICAEDNIVRNASVLKKSIEANTEKEFEFNSFQVDGNEYIAINHKRGFVKSAAQYWRWDIAGFTTFDKALYFDIDCIVTGDVAELWDIDIGDNLIGAVRDKWTRDVRGTVFHQADESVLSLDLSMPSYYSGQLIINSKLWRKENIKNMLIEFAKKYNSCDMLALNYVCRGRIFELPPDWCVSANYETREGKLYHWHGKNKPWNGGCRNQEIWDKYAK